MMAHPDQARATMAREVLGNNPADLGGSAWQAAGASFVLFTQGAIVPVAPFLLRAGPAAVITGQPKGGIVGTNEDFSFRVQATGSTPWTPQSRTGIT